MTPLVEFPGVAMKEATRAFLNMAMAWKWDNCFPCDIFSTSRLKLFLLARLHSWIVPCKHISTLRHRRPESFVTHHDPSFRRKLSLTSSSWLFSKLCVYFCFLVCPPQGRYSQHFPRPFSSTKCKILLNLSSLQFTFCKERTRLKYQIFETTEKVGQTPFVLL